MILSRRTPVFDLHVETGARGYGVAVWTRGSPEVGPDAAGAGEQHRVFASVRRPGAHAFRRPRPIAPVGSEGVQIGLSREGQTVVTWRDDAGLPHAAFRTPDETWSEPQRLSDQAGSIPHLAVGADGTAVAAWRQRLLPGGEVIVGAVRPPGGQFGIPQLVGGPPIGIWGPEVAVMRRGRAVIAWSGVCESFDPDMQQPAQASILARVPMVDRTAHVWGPPEPIPKSECPDSGLRVAIDGDGTVVVVVSGGLEQASIRASVRPPGGGFSEAGRISRPSHVADFAELGMSASGRAIAVWHVYTRGHRGLWGAVRPTGGAFGSSRIISGRPGGLHGLSVAPTGQALALWQSPVSFRLKAAFMPPGQWFREPESVSDALPRHALTSHDVAVGGGGRALAVWSIPAHDDSERGVFVSSR